MQYNIYKRTARDNIHLVLGFEVLCSPTHHPRRGFEGKTELANKVRVWTFCGAKGCEADVVVVFGFDTMDTARVTSLNQMGVALSRAKQRLIVIHGRKTGPSQSYDDHAPLVHRSALRFWRLATCGRATCALGRLR